MVALGKECSVVVLTLISHLFTTVIREILS